MCVPPAPARPARPPPERHLATKTHGTGGSRPLRPRLIRSRRPERGIDPDGAARVEPEKPDPRRRCRWIDSLRVNRFRRGTHTGAAHLPRPPRFRRRLPAPTKQRHDGVTPVQSILLQSLRGRQDPGIRRRTPRAWWPEAILCCNG
jgi:hypothetical protein